MLEIKRALKSRSVSYKPLKRKQSQTVDRSRRFEIFLVIVSFNARVRRIGISRD